MKKILLVPLLLTILILTVIPIVFKTLQVPATAPHHHANFAVFINGQQVDFSSPRLMSIQPCTDDQHISSDPLDNVHLHDQVGNVVHVHAERITWNHLFESIKFDIDKSMQSTASGVLITSVYRNGEKSEHEILGEPIQKQDRLLLHIATQSGSQKIDQDPVLVKEYEATGTNANEYDEGKIGIEKCGSSHATRSMWKRFKIAFHL